MHALRKDSTYEIRRHIYVFLVNSFFLCICFNCFVNVKQGSAECLRTLAGLTLMSFVDDNGVFSICDLVKVFVSKQEFLNCTDDNSLLEKIGVSVRCVDTGKTNIKLTTKDDLLYAEFLFSERGLK